MTVTARVTRLLGQDLVVASGVVAAWLLSSCGVVAALLFRHRRRLAVVEVYALDGEIDSRHVVVVEFDDKVEPWEDRDEGLLDLYINVPGLCRRHKIIVEVPDCWRLLVVRAAVFLVAETEVKRDDDGSFHISSGQRTKGLVAAAIGTLQEEECTQVDRTRFTYIVGGRVSDRFFVGRKLQGKAVDRARGDSKSRATRRDLRDGKTGRQQEPLLGSGSTCGRYPRFHTNTQLEFLN
ncbi:hypothetical protein V494_00998 [Pseudogymnoascus sp. VKM F-4513 (FW-928)]|nr:hypothetical protein V494_00998 [Pseudogymnoascus sp. VKM F-4513 (FW-928)]